MFYDELQKYSWDDTTRFIQSRTARDVETALSKEHLTIEDFMALVSPAAAPYLEQMAQLSHRYTLERFGKTISMYIPMYVSNACTNSCVYCGFNHNNPLERVTLTLDQVKAECEAIRKLGPFENLLIVSGEFPTLNGVDYLEEVLHVCRPYFN
ncbi:MAG: 2-iminoacetate synthase ThiH, partial [Duncaniella sp.]|nr:2-iminoacetate synthase ThiH [Duncaniella sp.]